MVHQGVVKAGFAWGFALMLLAGCSSDGDEKAAARPCPQVAVVKDLSTYLDYGRAEKAKDSDLVGQALMVKGGDECEFEDDQVITEISLRIFGKKGPRLGEGGLTTPYFVAVLDPADNIVSKETMSASLKFGQNGLAEFQDILRITLPKVASTDPSQLRVWVGFQLGPEQIRQMRSAQDQQTAIQPTTP